MYVEEEGRLDFLSPKQPLHPTLDLPITAPAELHEVSFVCFKKVRGCPTRAIFIRNTHYVIGLSMYWGDPRKLSFNKSVCECLKTCWGWYVGMKENQKWNLSWRLFVKRQIWSTSLLVIFSGFTSWTSSTAPSYPAEILGAVSTTWVICSNFLRKLYSG